MVTSDGQSGAIPRVRTHASEAASEAAFALLDALWLGPLAVAVLDRDLRFVQVNEPVAQATGIPVKEHAGRTIREVLERRGPVAEGIGNIESLLRGVIETGRPRTNVPLGAPLSDGRVREWLCSSFPVRGPSEVIRGVCVLASDATDDRDRQAAIERARAVAERIAGRLMLLQDVTAALSAARDLAGVAAVVVERAREALGAVAVTLRRLVDGEILELVGTGGLEPSAAEQHARLSLRHDTPLARAARLDASVWLESRAALRAGYGDWTRCEAAALGEAFAVLPLSASGTVLGTLGVIFPTARVLDLEERAFVSGIARQCAQAVERATLFDSEREQRAAAQAARDRLQRLFDITAALSQARTPADVLSVLMLQAHRALDVAAAVAYVRDGDALELVASIGGTSVDRATLARLPLDAPFPAAMAARDAAPLWFETAQALARAFPRLGELVPYADELGAFAALPLRIGDQVLGSVGFGFDAPRTFGRDDRDLLLAAAEQCALALDRARLVDLETQSRAALDAVVENAPIGVAFLDRKLRFVRVNPVLAEMDGISPEAHVGKTVRELLPGLPVDRIEEGWREVLRTGAPVLDVEIDGETPAAPGKRRSWVESWYPVRSEDEILGVGSLVREVTREREAEEFQRNVLGVVGHDLRNPLSAVVMSARLLLGPDDPAPDRSRLATRIVSNASRMDRIISVLLDYARVRGGQPIPLRPRPCDVSELVGTVIEECLASRAAREVRRRSSGDGLAEWDPDRVTQALANLVSNALDHGAPRTPVEVHWRGEADEVVIEVSNEGPPIPPAVLPRIFEPFRRATRDDARGGLGLGLFIAHAIAVAHGGAIEALSAEGAPTVFTLRLPRRIAR
jgi:PAS domain S-box-containing protein